MVFFLATALTATEYITAAKSKGEVLLVVHVDEKTKKASAVAGLQKQTLIFHWEDVSYDIKIKDNVDGWVEPGTLTALMGASGAGKTTLLDTLASRVTMGVVTGSMFVDGQQRDESFQRKTRYVQQQDLHLQTSTVCEPLIFSARLRQPQDVPDAEKVAYCSEVIRLLGMEKYADAVVGVPGEGRNVEQRKRLTIGVELAPTLDNQMAWSICTLLRDLANNGQAILCTIHQPSALLFQEFDRFLFLARGGRTVYFGDIGENSKTLTSYFKPQVIGAAPGGVADRDYADAWRQSDEYVAMKKELAEKRELSQSRPQPTHKEKCKSRDYSEFSAPFRQQFQLCLYRVFQQLYRTPSYIYSKTFLSITTALFIGFTFYKADNTLQGLQNQMFSIFMLMTIFGNLVNQIMPHFVTQRSLYKVRERPSKAYSWVAFMLANICAELPWNTLMSVFIFFGWYYPIGLYRNAEPTGAVTERGALLFLLLWSFLMFTSTFTHMIIAAVEVAENGGNIATLLFSLTILFCGVLVTPSKLPGFWIFMYRISPFTYLVDAMLSVSLANAPASCSSVKVSVFNPPSRQTCGQYLSDYIPFAGGFLANPNATSQCEFYSITDTNVFLAQVNSFYSHHWRNFGLMWAYVGFNLFAALFLYWLSRVPKNTKKN
ncbi:pleiotropic ABC efflux transporter of multiple drugs [Lentinula aff. detonsa]|nr:pleiotropic ABC efflux transporter of multiple drugs [Lentinula aff. detonsa]